MNVSSRARDIAEPVSEPHLIKFLAIAAPYSDPRRISSIVELGARDCGVTRALSALFPQAHVHSFECNPDTLPVCRLAAATMPNVTFVEKAVGDTDGEVAFFPIDPDRTVTEWSDGNPGASSLFRASGKYPVESYVQNEIRVSSTTLETYMRTNTIESIDLLWMDIQGAELMALQGMRDRIREVQAIITEVEFLEIYSGQPLFDDLLAYLHSHGFRLRALTSATGYSADALFLNTRYITSPGRLAELWCRDAHLRSVRYLGLRARGLARLAAETVLRRKTDVNV